jgi:hypothetical protein
MTRDSENPMTGLSSIVPFDDISRFFLGGIAQRSASFGSVVVPIVTVVIEWMLFL